MAYEFLKPFLYFRFIFDTICKIIDFKQLKTIIFAHGQIKFLNEK